MLMRKNSPTREQERRYLGHLYWTVGLIVIAALLFWLAWALTPEDAESQALSVSLKWTAVGDDSLIGTASSYQLRWNNYAPTPTTIDAWWATGNRATGLPVPAPSGTVQTTRVTPTGGFASGKTYYFLIRVLDEAGNISTYSNAAAVPVKDLSRPAAPDDLEED
jgi:hypothetical protein